MPTNLSLKPRQLRPGDKVTLTVIDSGPSSAQFAEAFGWVPLVSDTVLEVTRPERMVSVPESFIAAAKAWANVVGPPDSRRYSGPVNELLEGVAALDEQATP